MQSVQKVCVFCRGQNIDIGDSCSTSKESWQSKVSFELLYKSSASILLIVDENAHFFKSLVKCAFWSTGQIFDLGDF